MEDAVEPIGLAIAVAMGVVPSAPVANIPALDRHLVLPRPEPLDEEVRVGVGAVRGREAR
jgi:hypothetical protein